jgi:hypothetical protein
MRTQAETTHPDWHTHILPHLPASHSGRDLDAESYWIELLGFVVKLRGNDPGVLGAVADFYHPYYTLVPGCPPCRPDLTVTLVCLPLLVPEPAVEDMRVYRSRPQYSAAVSGWRLLRRHDPDITVAVRENWREVAVLGPSPREVELQARALVRDQILQRIEHAAGSVIVHAAAAADTAGCGVAILGNRNAGKTTALLALLGIGGYDFVTADRLSLRCDRPGQVRMTGVPARANMHAASFDPGQPLRGLEQGADWRNSVENKVLVDIDALTRHFSTAIRPEAGLATVVLPQVTECHPGPPVTKELTDAVARAAIRPHVLKGDSANNTHRPWLGLPLPQGSTHAEAIEQVLDGIIASSQTFTFTGNYSSYLTWLTTVFKRST